jgi:small-conductance mechanosensitive channel
MLCLCTALSAAADAPPAASASQQEDAIIAHLNSTLTWYRQVQESDGWIVQPSDEIYRTTQRELTSQVVVNAFAYGRAMAGVIGDEDSAAAKKPGDERALRLSTLEATNTRNLASLNGQQTELDARIAAASPQDRPALIAQREVIQAQIDLDSALGDALGKATALSTSSNDAGNVGSFAAKVASLRKAAPAVLFAPGSTAPPEKNPPKAAVSESSDGLFNRASTLFSLMRYRRAMDVLMTRTDELQAAANGLANPIATELRATIQQGTQAGDGVAQMTDAARIGQVRDKIEGLTARFKNLSAALMPLRAEADALQQTRNNISEWKRSVVRQTDVIIRVFLARAVALVIALVVLLAVSEVWRRATFRYVRDVRRRRQFLLIRRFATAILMTVIIIMGFVSNFSSFATFAGFITAGIAVALQTIILSIAAYFFLIGRYGVRVGDRVTVSGVTGDVIDIGLVRVFLMELAGTGIDLHPTGRVVVLANSALFSTTPLYKQLPGTDYTWHEVFVSMAADADTAKAESVLLAAVNGVYGGYRQSMERQHGDLERILDYKTDLPVPSGHVRFTDAGLEVVIRYPAEIRRMSQIDEQVTLQVLAAVRGDEEVKKSLATMPRIRAAVKS